MLNLFMRRGRRSEFLIWRTLRLDNYRRSQKWSPRKCGKQSKFKNSDLCCFTGMAKHVEGIWAGKYDKWNMSREIYIALFCYCYQLLFSPAHQLLRQWITGGQFPCACVLPLNDNCNSMGASNLMVGNRKLVRSNSPFKSHFVGALNSVLSYKECSPCQKSNVFYAGFQL